MNIKQKVLKANVEFHELTALEYEGKAIRFNKEFDKRMNKIFKNLSKKHPKGKLLEVGCGTGVILKIAKKYFKDLHGCDISPKILSLSKKYTKNLKVEDINKMSYKTNTFDVVVCYSTLHHLYDLKVAVNEMGRVTNKGGTVYIDNDPNYFFYKAFSWWLKFHRRFLAKNIEENKKIEKLRRLAEYHQIQKPGINPEEVKKHFLNAGFESVDVFYRYPDNPDFFTKTIRLFQFIVPKKYLCYHYVILATK